MSGRTWYKEGVIGDLTPIARKGFGRLANDYYSQGLDFFVTSIREGTHSPGSLHYCGMAFDYDRQGRDIALDRAALGNGWDVVDESNHRHAEYDPK